MRLYIPDLNRRQLDKLSDISSDIGLVILGSVVFPVAFDKFNIVYLTAGSVATLMFWLISLWIRR